MRRVRAPYQAERGECCAQQRQRARLGCVDGRGRREADRVPGDDLHIHAVATEDPPGDPGIDDRNRPVRVEKIGSDDVSGVSEVAIVIGIEFVTPDESRPGIEVKQDLIGSKTSIPSIAEEFPGEIL